MAVVEECHLEIEAVGILSLEVAMMAGWIDMVAVVGRAAAVTTLMSAADHHLVTGAIHTCDDLLPGEADIMVTEVADHRHQCEIGMDHEGKTFPASLLVCL